MAGSDDEREQFDAVARESGGGLVSDFYAFLRQNKKWWLVPIVLILLGVAALAVFGGTAAAPFIYTLF